MAVVARLKQEWIYELSAQKKEIRSLSDDGNENGKKDKQNNNFARASRFFVHFSAVVARLQRQTA